MPTISLYPVDGSAPLVFSGTATDYRLLLGYSGFEKIPVTHKTVITPGQHGATVTDTLMQPRQISIPLQIMADTLSGLKTLISALDAALTTLGDAAVLTYLNDDGNSYYAYVRGDGDTLTAETSLDGRTPFSQKVTVSLIAHDPFIYGGTTHLELMSTSVVNFIPWYIPWYIGGQGATKNLTNSGSWQTPVKITFNGPITNPVLTRSYVSGGTTITETISVTKALLSGERIEIQTGPGQQSCYYYDTGGVEHLGEPYVDIASVYWQLMPGLNRVTLSNTTAGTQDHMCSIQWADRYVGVG